MRFEWNQTKAVRNKLKHGVSFDEAVSVFYDELAIQFDDFDSSHEERFLLLGQSYKLRILLVSHCERSSGDVIRIISARKAISRELNFYPSDL